MRWTEHGRVPSREVCAKLKHRAVKEDLIAPHVGALRARNLFFANFSRLVNKMPRFTYVTLVERPFRIGAAQLCIRVEVPLKRSLIAFA
jgi:hypothetical protein